VNKKCGKERGKMKKWALALGMLLLLTTPILISMSSQSESGVRIADQAGEAVQDWECKANFSKGEIVAVTILQNISWGTGPYAVDEDTLTKYVPVEVADPVNGTSSYELQYMLNPSLGVAGRLYGVNFTELSVGAGLIPFTLPYHKFQEVTFIAGIANYTGTYVASINYSNVWPYLQPYDTPSWFAFYRGYLDTAQPYSSLLYVALTAFPISIVLLVYGSGLRWGKKGKRRSATGSDANAATPR
jgi:hypothetical protein